MVHPVKRGGEGEAASVLVVSQGIDQGWISRRQERQEIDVTRGDVTKVILADVPGTESVTQRQRGESREPPGGAYGIG